MDLMITGELAKTLLAKMNKDEMRELAEQYVNTIEPNVLGPFLLKEKEFVVDLLAAKLEADMDGTIKALQKMPERKRKRKSNGKAKKAKTGNGEKQTRTRLTDEDIEKLKGKVCRFVGGVESASAGDIKATVDFPSQGAYARVMKELMAAEEIVSEGEKRNTVYMVPSE